MDTDRGRWRVGVQMRCVQTWISVKKKKEKKTYLGGGVDAFVLGRMLHLSVDMDRWKEKHQKKR